MKLTFFKLAVLSREGPGECIDYSVVWTQLHFWFRHFYVILTAYLYCQYAVHYCTQYSIVQTYGRRGFCQIKIQVKSQ